MILIFLIEVLLSTISIVYGYQTLNILVKSKTHFLKSEHIKFVYASVLLSLILFLLAIRSLHIDYNTASDIDEIGRSTIKIGSMLLSIFGQKHIRKETFFFNINGKHN